MSKPYEILGATLILLVFSLPILGNDSEPVADAETQDALRRLVASDAVADDEQWLRLSRVIAIAGRDHRRFVQQVMLFATTAEDQIGVVGVFRTFRWAAISDAEIVAAASPFLYCENAKLRKQARRLLPFSRSQRRIGTIDLSDYSGVIVDVPDSPDARSLQRAVFELTPESAFLLFHTRAKPGELVSLRRDARKVSNALFQKLWLDGLPDGDVDDETKGSLATLALSKHWWARLFVAEVMVQHKEFRNERVIDAMMADENELVRNSIRSIHEPDELRFAKVDK